MAKKVKKVNLEQVDEGWKAAKTAKESLVNSELNELKINADSTIKVAGCEVTICDWINGVESAVADEAFRTANPQSHRILGATLNMLKSARDHLGDR